MRELSLDFKLNDTIRYDLSEIPSNFEMKNEINIHLFCKRGEEKIKYEFSYSFSLWVLTTLLIVLCFTITKIAGHLIIISSESGTNRQITNITP